MMRWLAGVLALAPPLLALAGCRPPPPTPVAAPRYVVGAPYTLGGLWSYPREDFGLSETGIAVVLPDRTAGRRTANGEIFDPEALLGAHRTLQLPVIVTVTHLENGRSLDIRLTDRGPERPGRILGLSRRAAELLGVPESGAAQVRVAVDAAASRPLAAALPTDEARLAIATAPRGAVERESLAPPPGTRASATQRSGAAAPTLVAATEAPTPIAALPEQVREGPPQPGQLVLELGRFFRRDLAERQAARLAGLGARAETLGRGREAQTRVRIGPLPDLAAADRAIAAALAAGLPEVTLRVE